MVKHADVTSTAISSSTSAPTAPAGFVGHLVVRERTTPLTGRAVYLSTDALGWVGVGGTALVSTSNLGPNTIVTPDFVGQIYISSVDNVYIATSLANNDWVDIGGAVP